MKSPKKEKPSFSHKKLLEALYWAWDGFDRCAINFFCIYNTAESIIEKKELSGEAIYLGVRKLDWEGSSKRVFDIFAGPPDVKTDDYDIYMVNNVPVYVYSFLDDLCIRNPQIVLYERENFNLPNTYERFLELYGPRII